MRVITGSARGKKLKTLDGLDVRPTSDRVKEALFSIVHFQLPGASVLDLFAGSGQLGIEALSRGAAHCVFVDKSVASIDTVKENLTACGLYSDARVLHMDSLDYLVGAKSGLDIVFIDPPYRNGLVEKALPLLEPKLSCDAVVICEHEKELVLPETVGRLVLKKQYRYGKIMLTAYEIPQDDEREDAPSEEEGAC
ncbi:MAG: 16S rRNA (guanine(966)-N(2))-methyltransferase RsmD [Oscillospiraceae bacterium]